MLSEKTKQLILNLQTIYPEKRSALIPALHLAQKEQGFLPEDIQEEVGQLFDINTTEINAIVTFYDMFYEKPIGKHLIHVCKNLSCMLRGSDQLLAAVCDKLNIEPGQTTADKEFTVIASECLAACDKAPMMLINDKVYGPVLLENIDAMLKNTKKTCGHPCPIYLSEEAEHE